MKKILSVLLTVITVFCFTAFAFAKENADNTFDNFTPETGKKAPENWYDPCCYDGEGLLRKDALSGGNNTHSLAFYCKKHKKIFTTSVIAAITKHGVLYAPYSYEIPSENEPSKKVKISYCPYCGETEANGSFTVSHTRVFGVAYGADCPSCGLHNISFDMFVSAREENNGNLYCLDCKKKYKPEMLTRYISSEMCNAEYGFIFAETAYKYGNGTDCPSDDLVLFAEDDVFLRREDVPKNDLFSMTVKKYIRAILRWLDTIYNKIKGLFK